MNISLRAMEPSDIDDIYRWENDPSIWEWSASHQPFSRHVLQQFIDESSQSDIYASRQLRLMADAGERAVGCVDLFDFDPYNSRAALGLLVDSSMRGQGVGHAMLREVERFAQRHLLLHQLHCIIAVDNHACLRLFDECGYNRSGVLKEWVRHGQEWHDAVLFQKTLAMLCEADNS